MPQPSLGFIGAGHMNGAIIKGIFENESPPFLPSRLFVSCKEQQTAEKLSQTYGINAATDNRALVRAADLIILGVKPQQLQKVLTEIKDCDFRGKTVVSIAAGITFADYRKILGDNVALVRAMPNMAAACQASVTGVYSEDELPPAVERTLEDLFTAIGSVVWLDDETQLDGITALSGSGIAYFFRLMLAMREAGERYGFEGGELYDIISLTALSASSLLLEDKDHPDFAHWVEKIAVPQGTTEAAMKVFDQHHFDAAVADAMQAVVSRSRALSEDITRDW